jgi:hypothetical protein
MAPPFSAGRDVPSSFGEDNMVERAVRAMRATPGLSPAVDVRRAWDNPASPAVQAPVPWPVHVSVDVPTDVPTNLPTDVHLDLPSPAPLAVPTPVPTPVPMQAPTPVAMSAPMFAPVSAPRPWQDHGQPTPDDPTAAPWSSPVEIDFHAPVEEVPEPAWHPDLTALRVPKRQPGAPASASDHHGPVAWRVEPDFEPAGVPAGPLAPGADPNNAAAADAYGPGFGTGADGPDWAGRADGNSALATAGLPSFVRNAQRAAWWQQPKVMLALAAACGGLLLTLGLQAAFEYRESLAARLEVTRPALEAGCRLLGCTVGAPRLLDAEGVSVENSGLVRVEKTNTYKLSVALRNRATTAVAVPALELSLTDSQGKLMARRVLRASDFGVTQNTVPAGRELGLQATLLTAFSATTNPSQEPVAGYTIELFYP